MVPLLGSEDSLKDLLRHLSAVLGLEAPKIENLPPSPTLGSSLRLYHSVVLTTVQMDRLIETLEAKVAAKCSFISGAVVRIRPTMDGWEVDGPEGKLCSAKTVVCAGGRLGSRLLEQAGADPQPGRGLDVGVRIEFLDAAGSAALRSYGPDAKIIRGRCRTFCLNSPGRVYRYPFGDFSIAGGVVADSEFARSNFGLLCRLDRTAEIRDEIVKSLRSIPKETLERQAVVSDAIFGETESVIRSAFGEGVFRDLLDLGAYLGEVALVDWSSPHIVHFPLLDWHWNTYALPKTHRTSLSGVYAVGDIGGHARGLLQAAASGWIAANEVIVAYEGT
ncbi:hypothetical protein [Bradyrhizobium retamae]|uniref:hypothetical protein n=1 Tax=Bradyrhizobium retamae TaxID=1300035 RepID=UPI001FD92BF9|nr:hypothetical protein [Bradyrhizobium retamae]